MYKLIQEWKRKYNRVFSVKTKLNTYIYRNLNISEISYIHKSKETHNSLGIKHTVLGCVLYPNYNEIEHADVDILLDIILTSANSLYNDKSKQFLRQCEINANDSFLVWKDAICRTLPYISYEYINKCDMEEFFTLLKFVEKTTNTKLIVEDDSYKHKKASRKEVQTIEYENTQQLDAILDSNNENFHNEYIQNKRKNIKRKLKDIKH